MSIGTNGISNNTLASNLSVTKQSASKVIKEPEEIGLVCSKKSSTDVRSAMLYLTDKGTSFYGHITSQMDVLEEEYKKWLAQRIMKQLLMLC